MIKGLRVKNFRSQESAELIFSPGVNVIVGDPDQGKTNLLRAIYWVLTNRPLGFRFHSTFAKSQETEVELSFIEGGSIALKKTKSNSTYAAKFPGSSPKEYTALKADVPVEVEKISQIGEVNIQEQLDGPFMVGSSPSEAARIVSRITRLEKADRWVSALTTYVNTVSRDKKKIEVQIDEKELSLKKLPDLDEMEEEISALEDLSSSYDRLVSDIDSLSELIGRLSEFRHIKEEEEDIKQAEAEIASMLLMAKDLIELEEETDSLIRDIQALENLTETSRNFRKTFKTELGEFERFVDRLDSCPFCRFCKTDIHKHSLDEMLKEFD